jgi:hypothetical protein
LRTVQILGKGRGPEVPFPPDSERWGISDLAFTRYSGIFTDWTRWFDLHHTERIKQKRPQTWDWYQTQTKPIYLWSSDTSIPASTVYPLEHIQDYFKTARFGSSFDWLIALAIFEKFEQIEIVWCRMKDGVEIRNQLPTANYWIGQAEARGIPVIIHGDSALHQPEKRYGYEITYN